MKRADLQKTGFLEVLKLERVDLPFFYRLKSYLLGSGFRSGLIKLSAATFVPKEKPGFFLNLEIELVVGLY